MHITAVSESSTNNINYDYEPFWMLDKLLFTDQKVAVPHFMSALFSDPIKWKKQNKKKTTTDDIQAL